MINWLSRALGWLRKWRGDGDPGAPAHSASTPSTPLNPYQPASDRLRQTATWLAATLAAVAAIMLAGTQLSSIGSISFANDRWRLIAAIASALIVIGAVGYAVYLLTNVQMPSEGTLGEIRRAAKDPCSRLSKLAVDDSGLRDGRDTLMELLDEYEQLRRDQRQAEKTVEAAVINGQGARTRKEHAKADAAIAAARARKQGADASIAGLRPHIVTLAQLTSYLSLRERFSAARLRILIASLTAAAFLVIFVWAVNPPQAKTAAVGAVPQTPSMGRLLLTPAGIDQLGGLLGHPCAASGGTRAGIAVIALSATGDTFDVVVLPLGSCTNPVRVTIPLNLGRVVSASSVPLPGK